MVSLGCLHNVILIVFGMHFCLSLDVFRVRVCVSLDVFKVSVDVFRHLCVYPLAQSLCLSS